MNKAEMAAEVAQQHSVSNAEGARILDTVFGMLKTTLKKEGRVSVSGFGTFTVTERAARKGRNPATGEQIKIKASKSVRFKPAPDTKELVAKFKKKA